MKIEFFLKKYENAKIPVRQSEGAAAYDIYSLKSGKIGAQEKSTIETGVIIDKKKLEENFLRYEIFGRSGLAVKYGLKVLNNIEKSTEDTEELIVTLENLGEKDFEYEEGFRIAQVVIFKGVE